MTEPKVSNVNTNFINGLVFGFDVGTGSIGYAVRKGKEFLDVGVIICPEETGDLKTRRGLRRQRRTLRSKKYRRQWLRQELEKLGLPAPKENLHEPVALRVKAVSGEKLTPEELHTAIVHLWKRRGYLDHVPWSSHEEGDDHKKEEGVIKESISKLREEMKADDCTLPCHFLANHQQAYATTLYAKKGKDEYVAREVFSSLTPKNLASIYPQDFAAYCEAAYERYRDESLDIEAELKKTKGCVPENFTRKLCFSHFQRWKTQGSPEFIWPRTVKIPIHRVRLISVKDDTAVMPFSKDTHAYVKRTGFKEVRIHVSADGKKFVPVFVPYWRMDSVLCDKEIKTDGKPVAIIRRGMVVQTKKAFSTGQPPGKYRVLVMAQVQLKLLPHHIANKEEAILAFGFGKKGMQPVWSDFIRALGYELPHSASAQSESAGVAEA